MDYKQETIRFYEKNAKQYEEINRNYTELCIKEDLIMFLRSLKGKKILDLGSGPGRDSIIFKQKGLNPVCIDLSKAMIELCMEKGLVASVGDMENLNIESESFDGVWAYASLLHLPKSKIPSVLKKTHQLLRKDGIFYLGMKPGNFEGFVESEYSPGQRRNRKNDRRNF